MNDHAPQQRDSNTAGLIGFIISLISLIGCGGLLSPVSLIFSIVGLGKHPKGFAIAGLVLSLFGMLGFVIVLVVFGGMLLVAIAVGMAAAAIVAAIGQNAMTIIMNVGEHYEIHKSVPLSLDELDIDPADRTDTWGNDFVYVPSAGGDAFLLISAGPDGVLANADDYVGEIDFGGNDFDAELHRGYDDINPTQWVGLPLPDDAPALSEPPDLAPDENAEPGPSPDGGQ